MFGVMFPSVTFTAATVNVFVEIGGAVNIYIDIAVPPIGSAPTANPDADNYSNPKAIPRWWGVPDIGWIVRIPPGAVDVGAAI